MKFNLALAVASLSVLAQASPVSVPEANPIASPEDSLFKRSNVCWVADFDGPVNCREGAGTGYPVVRTISGSDRFTVSCKANGQKIGDTLVWDRIPDWGCWVTAYYTRGNPVCENGNVPWC